MGQSHVGELNIYMYTRMYYVHTDTCTVQGIWTEENGAKQDSL